MSVDSPLQVNTLYANNGGLPAKGRLPRSTDHRLIPCSDRKRLWHRLSHSGKQRLQRP